MVDDVNSEHINGRYPSNLCDEQTNIDGIEWEKVPTAKYWLYQIMRSLSL